MPSAVIRRYHYEPGDPPGQGRLLVEFRSGRRYLYRDVPLETAEALRRAFSKGDFFNRHIRDRFAFERLDEGSWLRPPDADGS